MNNFLREASSMMLDLIKRKVFQQIILWTRKANRKFINDKLKGSSSKRWWILRISKVLQMLKAALEELKIFGVTIKSSHRGQCLRILDIAWILKVSLHYRVEHFHNSLKIWDYQLKVISQGKNLKGNRKKTVITLSQIYQTSFTLNHHNSAVMRESSRLVNLMTNMP